MELKDYLYFDMHKELEYFNKNYDLLQGGFIYKSKLMSKALGSQEKFILNFNYSADIAIRNNFGYVYVIRGQYKGNTSYKIGKANDLNDRLKRFEVKIPFDIELFGSYLVKNPLEFESYLHRMFKHKRQSGEWFNLDLDDLKSIIKEGGRKELSDIRDAHEKEKIEQKKKMWRNKEEYTQYLESMLVMNGIKFEAWGI